MNIPACRTLAQEAAAYFSAQSGCWPESQSVPSLRSGASVAFSDECGSLIAFINSIVFGAGVTLLVSPFSSFTSDGGTSEAEIAQALHEEQEPSKRGTDEEASSSGNVELLPEREDSMILVRDIMYCKPGQVRPMVEKFQALANLGRKLGFGAMRVMTDIAAERYWTVVTEMEVESLERYGDIMKKSMEAKEFQEAMKGYHELVVQGRREVYQIEK